MDIDNNVETNSFLDDSNIRGNEEVLFFPLQRQSPIKYWILAPLKVLDLN